MLKEFQVKKIVIIIYGGINCHIYIQLFFLLGGFFPSGFYYSKVLITRSLRLILNKRICLLTKKLQLFMIFVILSWYREPFWTVFVFLVVSLCHFLAPYW